MGANVSELGVLKVAKPCHRDWEKMSGDDRARFCTDCQLTVYDLSEMTTDEARELIREKEGQLCVRFFARADGTVLTKDCPVGVKRHRRKLVASGAAVASLSLAALAFAVAESFSEAASEPVAAQPWPAAPAPVPECEKPSQQAAETPEPDEKWMESRRNQLGHREPPPARRKTMGALQIVRGTASEKKP